MQLDFDRIPLRIRKILKVVLCVWLWLSTLSFLLSELFGDAEIRDQIYVSNLSAQEIRIQKKEVQVLPINGTGVFRNTWEQFQIFKWNQLVFDWGEFTRPDPIMYQTAYDRAMQSVYNSGSAEVHVTFDNKTSHLFLPFYMTVRVLKVTSHITIH